MNVSLYRESPCDGKEQIARSARGVGYRAGRRQVKIAHESIGQVTPREEHAASPTGSERNCRSEPAPSLPVERSDAQL